MLARDNSLEQYTATSETGAGFAATRESGLVVLTPLTPAASSWLADNVGEDASWNRDGLIMELRYFPDLADAIIAAGFTFERDAYLN